MASKSPRPASPRPSLSPHTGPGRRIVSASSAAEPPPMVSGRWLLTAFAVTLALAALCWYGTMCLLFYQGQWQMLFHPSRDLTTTPANAGMAFNEIHFDVTDTGLPRLDGWWIPAAAPQSPWSGDTILYLHSSRGSLSDCVPALAALHRLGINLFAFDYRGFGHSQQGHPTEARATADSIAAWTYLTDIRHIPPRSIVVFGDGVGATFAARIAVDFAPAGIVLEDPNLPARQLFARDARARMMPLGLLQNETLDPASDLTRAHTPRLFLDRRGNSARTRQLFNISSDPKQYYDLRSASEAAVSATMRRFLDEVFH